MKKTQGSLGKIITTFINDSRSVGILLLLCTCCSLLIANLPAGAAYLDFWASGSELLHHLHLPHTLHHFINDGLMTVFFFLAGMEIKTELKTGALASVKSAALPVAAAVGGMLVPALFFTLFNKGTDFIGGWAIPASTDIAFSLGVAALLGKRVPVALKVFLTALAIIDDLGAIIIIALFYGEPVKLLFLLLAALTVLAFWYLNKRNRSFGWLHLLLALALWYFVYNSGIHATVAGVIVAFMVPQNQLPRFQHALHHPVNFIIMPVFALANTAIIFPEQAAQALNNSLSWGIMLGLAAGKPVGIFISSWLMIRNKLAVLPAGVNYRQLVGAGMLAGIGFTMSIFVATLAFSDVIAQDIAKMAVLAASFLSMLLGFIWLRFFSVEDQRRR